MRKILAIASSLVFALSLAACGNGSNMDDNTSGKDHSGNSNGSSLQSTVESTVDNLTEGSMQNSSTASTAKISADEAKAAALKHAGLAEADVTGLVVDLDRDDGMLKYEVDFYSGGIEYDYDINAENGKVISADKDRD